MVPSRFESLKGWCYVPVVAKMFFSPPSVYAAKVQTEIERERAKARLRGEPASAEPEGGGEETIERSDVADADEGAVEVVVGSGEEFASDVAGDSESHSHE